jgi:hypothetical protein
LRRDLLGGKRRLPGPAARPPRRRKLKQEQRFFFEKKKQKTFRLVALRHAQAFRPAAPNPKSEGLLF